MTRRFAFFCKTLKGLLGWPKLRASDSIAAPLWNPKSAGIAILFGAVLFSSHLGLLGASTTGAAEKVLREWTFDQPGDLQGWQPGGHVRDTKVVDGVLRTCVVGSDPILVHEVFREPLPATATQVIEIRLYSPRAGTAEFFWSNTTETKYGGFSPGKQTPFSVREGWHVYRVRPFWQAEGRIIRLRLDLPPAQTVGAAEEYYVDHIRILELGPEGVPTPPDWDFRAGTAGWRLEGEGDLAWREGALVAELNPGAQLVAPPIAEKAETAFFFACQMAVNRPGKAVVQFATEKTNGLHSVEFPLRPGPQPRTYNIPVGGHSPGAGRVVYLAIQPETDGPVQLRLWWAKLSEEPVGPPDLEVDFVAIREALPRVGQICEVVAQVRNHGGEPARNVRAELLLPEEVYFASTGSLIKKIPEVNFLDPQQISWKIFSRRAGPAMLRLKLHGPEIIEQEAHEEFLPPPNLPKAEYVPPPQPVRGEFEVGVYYFPGWGRPQSWRPLEGFPERRPVLGYYQEGLPEVADWHIKWAVEHGITFFCYDWYWVQGRRQFEHALHEGFFHARYKDMMKFCLLWANHFGPGEHSMEDCEKVCRYWIDQYFRRPEYFKVNGRPLLVIFSVHSLERDLGIEGSRRAIEMWHRITEEAGVGKILVAGCGIPAQLDRIVVMGFDAITGYNWPSCGIGERRWAPFSEVASNYDQLWWRPLAKAGLLPVLTPVSAGWDSRPWHGNRALVLTDCTPEAFKRHLSDAKRFIEETGQPKVLLIEAWNEWGEGSFCEPHKRFGFGHLQAIRRVFCPQAPEATVFGPRDVGLALPEFSLDRPERSLTAWDYSQLSEPADWAAMMGLEEVRVRDGALRARSVSADPAFHCATRIRAKDFTEMAITIALAGPRKEETLQLFWATANMPFREEASVRITVQADGQFREYRLRLSGHPLWRGVITGLRLDPCSSAECEVAISNIRLIPASSGPTAEGQPQEQTEAQKQRPESLWQEHQERCQDILARMQLVMGPLPGPERRVPLEPQILKHEREQKFDRCLVEYSVEPGDRVRAWLLIPRIAIEKPTVKLPAMLCLHQTVAIGKDEPAGLGGNPNLHYAKELAERGYVTLAPDYLGGDIPEVGIRGGFGESRSDPYALGYVSGSMKGIWNHIRAVDYLVSLPFVDPQRIGVIGHSLGGYNSLFVACFEPRIRLVVTSCGFTSFPKYHGGNLTGWSHRGHMPRIATIYDKDPAKMPFDFPDVLAAIAPRPLFINAPKDDFFTVTGVQDCVAAVEPLYEAFGAAERLVAVYPDGGHDFPPPVREAAYQFVDRFLGPSEK